MSFENLPEWGRLMLPAFWVISWIFCIGAGIIKERAFSGFLWGLLFGPIGLIIVLLVLPNLRKKRLAAEAEAAATKAWQASSTMNTAKRSTHLQL